MVFRELVAPHLAAKTKNAAKVGQPETDEDGDKDEHS